MSKYLLIILAAMTLSGCAYQQPQAPATYCQEQLRKQRISMTLTSIELDECLAKPGLHCFDTAFNIRPRERSLGVVEGAMANCMGELRRTDPDTTLSYMNELTAYQERLRRVLALVEKAGKAGHF